MANDLIHEQAVTITELLPKLTRRLFALDMEDPASQLPLAQLKVCGILREGARTISCLSKELGITLSAATQLADRLEKSGMVERVTETDDRRVKCLQLTAYGQEIMSARLRRRIERVERMLSTLDPQERETMISVLRQIYEAGSKLRDAEPLPSMDEILS